MLLTDTWLRSRGQQLYLFSTSQAHPYFYLVSIEGKTKQTATTKGVLLGIQGGRETGMGKEVKEGVKEGRKKERVGKYLLKSVK